MTPEEFRSMRKALGLPASKLAKKLGLKCARTIYAYERGERLRIPGPIAVLMLRLLEDKKSHLREPP